ncbi:hypothetical protein ACQEU3_13785 [Spirillospora sp. CA-253888]
MPEAEQWAASGMEAEFPGIRAWFGLTTRSWWAVVPLRRGGLRLVEADSPRELREAIVNVATWTGPYSRRART